MPVHGLAGISQVNPAEVLALVRRKSAGRHSYGRSAAALTPAPPPGGLSTLARPPAGGERHAPPVRLVSRPGRSASM